LILAVTDQQAEILKFSIERGTGITLVLRGRGDTANETTLGATLDLLVSNFGLPLPNPAAPAVGGQEDLTPLPTTNTTPAATTPVTGATVTPTPTP
jgi:pilus assembly protein CpaB